MNLSSLGLAIGGLIFCVLAGSPALAQNAYVTNEGSGTVSVIGTATKTVIATIHVGTNPFGAAVTPDASRVYITNFGDNTVSVIDTATNTVTATILVGTDPAGLAVTPDGSKVYVANNGGGTVSVISTHTNTVIGVPITVGGNPSGVAVTPDSHKVYVANLGDNTGGAVSVIGRATNTVIGSPIAVATSPLAFGLFIQPGPRFAGTPGFSNCHGKSVSGLAQQYHGLNAAAAALGFSDVRVLQTAIFAFCGG
jgi:YVTN family beta-propeller protein